MSPARGKGVSTGTDPFTAARPFARRSLADAAPVVGSMTTRRSVRQPEVQGARRDAVHVLDVVDQADAQPIEVEVGVPRLERIERPEHARDPSAREHGALHLLQVATHAHAARVLADAEHVGPVNRLTVAQAGEADTRSRRGCRCRRTHRSRARRSWSATRSREAGTRSNVLPQISPCSSKHAAASSGVSEWPVRQARMRFDVDAGMGSADPEAREGSSRSSGMGRLTGGRERASDNVR